jgi:hypothetical protein
MAQVADRWHKSRPEPDEQACPEHRRVPSAAHGKGRRWQAQWRDGGRQRHVNFARRTDAEQFLERLGGAFCLVPKCGHSAFTEPPALLCRDHVDMVLVQLNRQRPAVHPELVYFIRNGNRIKIGWTTNLKSRLSALSLAADAVALTVPGGPDTEKAMHRKFASARVGRTEWFDAVPELEAFIAARL